VLTLELVNVSPDANPDKPESVYRYRVCVNSREIVAGTVAGHVRNAGWITLVRSVLDFEEMSEKFGLFPPTMPVKKLIAQRGRRTGRPAKKRRP